MLVLSRKLQEEIVIAENVRITVVEIKGNRVKLGITASREIPIRRRQVPPPMWNLAASTEVAEAADCA